ncbi:MAG: hypothetical protein A4S17_02110 [Proteobacteria bacterium HN_bin10]|nr:MAG: hypothetical protein A4S17_02110 [Proteobacteria bacterium HN_bin10]
MMRVELSAGAFSPEAEMAAFSLSNMIGAVASFVGYCRDEGGVVRQLELEHYPGFSEARVKELVRAVAEKHSLIDVLVVHRVGAIPAGDPIVLVAASSAHRAPALAAVAELMDDLKTEAPIWKKEVGARGESWIEPTRQDYLAAAGRRQAHGKQAS